MISIEVGSVQMDNQFQDAVYPVVLSTGGSKDSRGKKGKKRVSEQNQQQANSLDEDDYQRTPFLRVFLARSTSQKTVLKLAECSVVLDSIKLEIDSQFAITFGLYLVDMLGTWRKNDIDTEMLIERKDLNALLDRDTHRQQQLATKSKAVPFIFFKRLYISPIHLVLTLNIMRSTIPDRLEGRVFFQTVARLASLSAPIISFDAAHVSLNALELENLNANPIQLTKQFATHYKRTALLTVFRMVGQLDIIGNPIGFFRDVGSAARSLTTGSIGDMASHSIHGAFYGISRIYSSYSKAIGQLSFDGKYLRSKEQFRSQKASSPIGGIRQGASGLMKSLYSGATGLVAQPIRGAADGGAGGVVKGALLGAVGLAVKPVAGGFDFLSKTAEGLANIRGKAKQGRCRLPRPFGEHGSIIAYSEEHALVQYVVDRALRQEHHYNSDLQQIHHLGSKIKRAHYYVADVDKTVVVLTDDSVMKCSWNGHKLLWQYFFWQIDEVTRSNDNDGIGITLKLRKAPMQHVGLQQVLSFGAALPSDDTAARAFYDLFFTKLHSRHYPFHAVQDTQRKRSTAIRIPFKSIP